MVDLSVVFPSIRTKNLPKVCEAIDKSCSRHSYEIIIVGPYNLPELSYNIKFIKSWASPSVCWQIGSLFSNSEFWIDGSDDALFEPDVLSEAIEDYKFNKLNKYDVISLHLKEGTLNPETLEVLPNASTHSLNPGFFLVKYNPPFHKPCINQNWKLSLNFLIKTETFLELGGFDCGFEYINHGLHDIIFRIQSLGGLVYDFAKPGMLVAHMPEETGDHAPVHWAQKTVDTDRFNEIYDNLNSVQDRAFLLFDNWKLQPEVWKRRFNE